MSTTATGAHAAGTAPFDVRSQEPTPAPGRPTRAAWGALAAGVALFTGLLAWQGIGEVARALAAAGPGLLLVPLVHLPPLVADAMGWRRLLRREQHATMPAMVFARWIGESVNGLLPVVQVGGNVAKARVLARCGVPLAVAGASVVVDVTLVMLTQLGFTLLGLILLAGRLHGRGLLPTALVGFGLTLAMLLGFLRAQRAGLFTGAARLVRLLGAHGSGGALVSDAAALDGAVQRLHGERRTLAAAAAWHAASWLLGVAEILVGLALLGHPLGLSAAVLLESLGQAVRAAAFVVPGALGVQEGGYLLLGASVGLPPEAALALSLVRRVRDLLLGLPGLVAWQLDAARTRAREE